MFVDGDECVRACVRSCVCEHRNNSEMDYAYKHLSISPIGPNGFSVYPSFDCRLDHRRSRPSEKTSPRDRLRRNNERARATDLRRSEVECRTKKTARAQAVLGFELLKF